MMRVLIVDDEAPARDKLRRWLSEQADIELVARIRRRPERRRGDRAAAAGRGVPRHPDAGAQRPGSRGAARTGHGAAARVRHRLRRARDQGLRPERRSTICSSPTTRIACTRRWRASAHGTADGSTRAAVADRARPDAVAASGCWCRDGETLQLIDSATIDWLEADDNYVHVHTAARSYILRRTLQDLLAQLGEQRFARIHKSAAVNIAEVKAFTPLFKGDHEVQLRSGKVLRLSRRYKDELFARMGR